MVDKVEFPAHQGETPALDPGVSTESVAEATGIAPQTIDEFAGRVSEQATPTGEAPSVTIPQAEPAGDRPAWLQEKFSSPEDLAKAYTELEAKVGTDSAPTKDLGTIIESAKSEYGSTGNISEATRVELEKAGIIREVQDAALYGMNSQSSQVVAQLHNAAGGTERYNEMVAWAVESLPQDQQNSFNNAVMSGDMHLASLAVEGLMSRYSQAPARAAEPTLLRGSSAGGPGEAPYASIEQLKADMRTEEYVRGDPDFHAQVKRRLAKSDIL